MSEPIRALWFAAMKWAASGGAERINELPECFEREFEFNGAPALVSINGHPERNAKSKDGFEVPPFHVLLMVNGWPAVLCNKEGGTIMGGEADAEDRLIAAFEAATP